MLKKSQFFYFFLSFAVTFAAGFFIWNIFTNLNVSLKIFQASLISSQPEDLVPSGKSPAIAGQFDGPATIPPAPVEVMAGLGGESFQDQLDDIQEKLDAISQQVQELFAEQNQKNHITDADKEEKPKEDKIPYDENQQDQEDNQNTDNTNGNNNNEAVVCTGQININTASAEDLDKIIQVGTATAQKIIAARPFYSLNDLLKVSGIGEKTLQEIIGQGCAYVESITPPPGGGGGGADPVVYSKILISEIQISPIGQRFVELYNPDNTDVDLTGWYLQRKDANDSSWGSFVSSTNFQNKTILAGGYFLISKELLNSDILSNITLSPDNSLALKNPNGEISDKLGFGNALDPELSPTQNPNENQSIGRKFLNNTEQDADDNSSDFEIDAPTPKSQNVACVEPPVATLSSITITTPANKLVYNIGDVLDITGLVVTGTYSDNSTQIEIITADNITGFDSSAPATSQVLTITIGGQTTTYTIDVAGLIEQQNILINEIQINPIEHRFVELYNPNSQDVDLTGYYLQRKTATASSWGSFVSSTNFASKTIRASGYFLISRQLADSDILLDITLSDNNSLALKNSSRDIVDKVGYGLAQDFETAPAPNPAAFQILTRTFGIDTDNNSLDFSLVDTTSPTNLSP